MKGIGDAPRLGIRLHGGLTPQRCVELAVAAEAKGCASVWFAENPLERGTLPALAACAAATQRIELGDEITSRQRTEQFAPAMKVVVGARCVLIA